MAYGSMVAGDLDKVMMFIAPILTALVALGSARAEFSDVFEKATSLRRSTVQLYKELFDDVLPANLISVPSPDNLLEYRWKLDRITKRNAKEDILDAYQRANLKFWTDAISIRAWKCDPAFDDKLLARYQQHAFRVLPAGTNDNLYWEFEHFVGLIRTKYVQACEKKMAELINGTSAAPIQSIHDQLKRDPMLDDPIEDATRLVLSSLVFKQQRTCCLLRKRNQSPVAAYWKAYTEKVVNPCHRVASSRWMGNGILQYLSRFKPFHKLDDRVRHWYRYTEWCKQFVDLRLKHDTWDEVYGRLLEKKACRA